LGGGEYSSLKDAEIFRILPEGNSSGMMRNIAECFAEPLGKILETFCEFKIFPQPQH